MSDLEESDFLKADFSNLASDVDLSQSDETSDNTSDHNDEIYLKNYLLQEFRLDNDLLSESSSESSSSEFDELPVFINNEPTQDSFLKYLYCQMQTKLVQDRDKLFTPISTNEQIVNMATLLVNYTIGIQLLPEQYQHVQNLMPLLDKINST